MSREKWIVHENAHPAVKTQEEHYKIFELLEQRKIIPMRSRRGTYVLSGILRCGICESTLQFLNRTEGGKQPKTMVKKCQHRDPYGNQCDSRGLGNVEIIFDVVFDELEKYEKDLQTKAPDSEQNYRLERVFGTREKELNKHIKALDNYKELFAMGDLDKTTYIRKRDEKKEVIVKLESEMSEIRKAIAHLLTAQSVQKKLDNVQMFRERWEKEIDPKEQNRLLRGIIDRIMYKRNEDNSVNLEVTFL